MMVRVGRRWLTGGRSLSEAEPFGLPLLVVDEARASKEMPARLKVDEDEGRCGRRRVCRSRSVRVDDGKVRGSMRPAKLVDEDEIEVEN